MAKEAERVVPGHPLLGAADVAEVPPLALVAQGESTYDHAIERGDQAEGTQPVQEAAQRGALGAGVVGEAAGAAAAKPEQPGDQQRHQHVAEHLEADGPQGSVHGRGEEGDVVEAGREREAGDQAPELVGRVGHHQEHEAKAHQQADVVARDDAGCASAGVMAKAGEWSTREIRAPERVTQQHAGKHKERGNAIRPMHEHRLRVLIPTHLARQEESLVEVREDHAEGSESAHAVGANDAV